MLNPGHILQNRYQIEHLLGQGGFGAVYCARHTRLKKLVALKETLQMDAAALQMFEREAEVLASLDHPALPAVSDYFDEQGCYYIVMDYIPGEDLEQYLARQPNHCLSEQQALAITLPVLAALEYMHNRAEPIIHRDIKPGNIRITPEHKVYLVDFGMAKVYAPRPQRSTTLIAVTPGFSPPEQYRQRTDTRSDLYALGATLYAMLGGTAPTASLDRLAGDQLIPLHTLNPAISPAIEQVVARLLALQPEARYPSAGAVQQALRSIEPGKPHPAIPTYSPTPTLNLQDGPFYFQRGLEHYNKGHYAAAIADYTRAITINPRDAASYYNRAVVYDEQGDYDRAIADYTQAIALNPNDTDAYNNRGLAYESKGDYDQALADYESALKCDPTNGTAHDNRAILIRRSRGRRR